MRNSPSSVAADADLPAFFEARAPRVAELRAQYRAGWPASVGGLTIGCLTPFAIAIVFLVRGSEWSKHPWFRQAALGAFVTMVGLAAIGLWLYLRGQKAFAPVDRAVDLELLGPFAALLVEGATLEHPDDSILEWRASLLFPRAAHVYDVNGQTTRISGRLAGLPAELDEIFLRFRRHKNSRKFGGWVVRIALPFPVGGHLRVRAAYLGYESLQWQEGFAPLPDATARLGTPRHVVDAAAPGTTAQGADEPAVSGVPVESLLTDALFDLLRDGEMQLAAVARTLFVLVPNVRAFDNRKNVATFDVEYGRETSRRVRLVEAIAREVVHAGSGSR